MSLRIIISNQKLAEKLNFSHQETAIMKIFRIFALASKSVAAETCILNHNGLI